MGFVQLNRLSNIMDAVSQTFKLWMIEMSTYFRITCKTQRGENRRKWKNYMKKSNITCWNKLTLAENKKQQGRFKDGGRVQNLLYCVYHKIWIKMVEAFQSFK